MDISDSVDIFLNEGEWINKKLEKIDINFSYSLEFDKKLQVKKSLQQFILLNTPITSLGTGWLPLEDFSGELKFNTNILKINSNTALSESFLERNKNIQRIRNSFHNILSQNQTFNINMKFL
jgi:hypothetical protein